MKDIVKPLIVLSICILAIAVWTRGFTSFSIFSYTLNAAGSLPRELSRFSMIDHSGKIFEIHNKKKYILLNFVYLNCPNVCHKVNNRLENIYKSLSPNLIPEELELITVSFDLKHDSVLKIKNYRKRFDTSIRGWTFAIPNTNSEIVLQNYLQSLGVWAMAPADREIINHSIYLFLISPENQIIKVFDPARENDEQIIKSLETWIVK